MVAYPTCLGVRVPHVSRCPRTPRASVSAYPTCLGVYVVHFHPSYVSYIRTRNLSTTLHACLDASHTRLYTRHYAQNTCMSIGTYTNTQLICFLVSWRVLACVIALLVFAPPALWDKITWRPSASVVKLLREIRAACGKTRVCEGEEEEEGYGKTA